MITIISVEVKEDDYIVELQRPDGSKLKVLIPTEHAPNSYENVIIRKTSSQPIGLNLVSGGHYT